MNYFFGIFGLFCVLTVSAVADDTYLFLDHLFSEIKTALNAEAVPEKSQTRQQQYPLRPQNNGISLGVYEALRSIAQNDELECISRLLCEAAAGGRPGFSGKQIQFDKVSLTKLMSYLNLDIGSSSPLLVFGKAALLGVSNRGDPYSCIINYPKCPKDQSRLLYYLNNHRGGFFQYFDKQYHKPGNYYPNKYRPSYNYQKYQKQFKRNKIQFENPGSLFEKIKKKAASDIYATKYSHSTLNFPNESYKREKPMVFPKSDDSVNPRILTKPETFPVKENTFSFTSSTRFPKKLNDLNFFPKYEDSQRIPAAIATDRLPSRLYFPENDLNYANYPKYPIRYSPNSFFPID